MTRMQGVLFDFGGTLDGDGVHWRNRFESAYAAVGIELPPGRFAAAYPLAERRLAVERDLRHASFHKMIAAQVEFQFEELGFDPDGAPCAAVARWCFEAARACLQVNRGVLAELRARGRRLGIVSNFPGNLAVVCDEFLLTGLLDTLVDSTLEGVSKPDPRLFSCAAERLRLAPEELWVVGDSLERDILPARTLGARTAWLAGKQAGPAAAGHADALIRAVADVLQLPGLEA